MFRHLIARNAGVFNIMASKLTESKSEALSILAVSDSDSFKSLKV